MKQQIARLSPHQNGKVFAVLMAVASLVFLIPFLLFMAAVMPAGQRPPMFMMVIVMPVMYLVIGYLSVAVGCLLYNALFKFIGGIEFETTSDPAR